MNNKPIGVCDSGVGGIVVLSEIIKLLPKESFVYLGDTGRFPYGTKSWENIVKYTKESIEFLISKNVKMVVVACGTSSTVLAEILKEDYDVPIIGVLEPTLTDINDNDKKIGVIATSRTIASKAWNELLQEKYPNLEIISNSCPILAPLAETGWTDNEIAELTVKTYLEPFKDKNIDKLILGCTHYPLFKKIIERELRNVELIDIGEKTAIYVKRFIEERNIGNSSKRAATYKINLTDIDNSYSGVINNLLKGIVKISDKDIKKAILIDKSN